MSRPRKLHLFNCDRTYKLDAVEELLKVTKAKLGFDSVEKHYFSLAQMSEMTSKTIPNLQMDMAVFVVHAHESRLSINEDNAGIGYAKIYRALLEATGGKVIIVIGGDDNYKNEDEEDRVFISRWAWRKISSQFSEEFLDGRKSFIFSWNKKHRAIHEEALVHYFDPSKKGKKFEYQPKPKQLESGKSAQTSSERNPLQKHQSVDEQRKEGIRSGSSSSAEQREKDDLFSHSSSTEQRRDGSLFSDSRNAEQRRDGSLFSDSRNAEQRRDGSLFSDSRNAEQSREDNFQSNLGNGTYRANMAPVHIEQRALPTKTEDLAILCCNVSEDSLHAVLQIFQGIAPRLNLSANPPVENLSPDKIEGYLKETHLKVCVLVVDGKTVKDAYGNLPQRKEEYRGLLETAANEVVEKVIILVCDTCSLPPKDEEIVRRTIEDIICRTGKGFTAWLKNGMLLVEPDDLAQVIMSTSVVNQGNPKASLHRGSRDPIGASGSVDDYTRSPSERDVSNPPRNTPANTSWQFVMLKSKLRHGKISDQQGDVEIWCPKFEVPSDIIQKVWQKYADYPEAGVKIENDNGELRWFVELKSKGEEGIVIADNETLMLKTRIRYGEVSFEKGDLEFIKRDWEVPQYIIQGLQRKHCATPDGELYVISDEQGKLRNKVHFGTKDNIVGMLKRAVSRKQ